ITPTRALRRSTLPPNLSQIQIQTRRAHDRRPPRPLHCPSPPLAVPWQKYQERSVNSSAVALQTPTPLTRTTLTPRT
ncbi:hypothetical protein BGZ54_002929, partial [Gamsiella multidivaricata]